MNKSYSKLIEEKVEEVINLMLKEGRTGIKSGVIRAMTDAINFWEDNKREILIDK